MSKFDIENHISQQINFILIKDSFITSLFLLTKLECKIQCQIICNTIADINAFIINLKIDSNKEIYNILKLCCCFCASPCIIKNPIYFQCLIQQILNMFNENFFKRMIQNDQYTTFEQKKDHIINESNSISNFNKLIRSRITQQQLEENGDKIPLKQIYDEEKNQTADKYQQSGQNNNEKLLIQTNKENTHGKNKYQQYKQNNNKQKIKYTIGCGCCILFCYILYMIYKIFKYNQKKAINL